LALGLVLPMGVVARGVFHGTAALWCWLQMRSRSMHSARTARTDRSVSVVRSCIARRRLDNCDVFGAEYVIERSGVFGVSGG
jgi:hypothetical protein